MRTDFHREATEFLDALLSKAIGDGNRELLEEVVYTTACVLMHDDGSEMTSQICDQLLSPHRIDDFYEFDALCVELCLDD